MVKFQNSTKYRVQGELTVAVGREVRVYYPELLQTMVKFTRPQSDFLMLPIAPDAVIDHICELYRQ